MSTIRSQLIELSSQLQNESRVTSRRKAGQQLIEILSDKRNRKILEKECRKDNELTIIWRDVINKSLNSANRILSGKNKPTLEDIMLPYRLLLAADSNESSSISSSSISSILSLSSASDQCDMMDAYSNGTLELFDEYNAISSSSSSSTTISDILKATSSKLSSKDIVQLLDYNLKALSIVEVEENTIIENNLLEMFYYLLSKSEYIIHYKINIEISKCLAEIENRLSSSNSNCIIPVAKAFASIIYQCCVKLSIDIHAFIIPCLNLVASWCASNSTRLSPDSTSSSSHTSSIQILPQMYSVVTNILSTNAELSIHF